MFHNHKAPGFTLLETVTVLGLLTTTLLITVVRFPTRQRQQNDERLFWQRLDVLWKRYVLLASTSGIHREVDFSADTRQVMFGHAVDAEHAKRDVVLKLPPTLRLKRNQQILIYKNGHPQLAVVVFYSSLHPHKAQKFSALMGWGAYRVATIEDARGFYHA